MRFLSALPAGAMLAACSAQPAVSPQPAAAVDGAASLDASALSIRPHSIVFTRNGGQAKTVAITGGTPPYSLKQSHPEIATVVVVAKNGSTWRARIVPVAHGSTVVTVSDARSVTAKLTIIQSMVCEPPAPQFYQLYPRFPKDANVPINAGHIFVALPSNDPLKNAVPEFFVRLVGSDGSVVTGGHFALTTDSPPPGSGSPPSPNYAVYARAHIPVLKSGIDYRVQFATPRYQCLPPFTAGQFTTK